jgi:hypothetical protein
MSTTPRLRIASLTAVLATGVALFGVAVGGMTSMDAELAAGVAPPETTTRFVSDEGPGWTCPEPEQSRPAPGDRPRV